MMLILSLLLATATTCEAPPCVKSNDAAMVMGARLEPPKMDRVLVETPNLACRAVDRDGKEVYRSRSRRNLFRRMSGYPKGRPGYVVDHIIPLHCGGCDRPDNMAWQTVEDARSKDRDERTCK
jgi:hypothetical protein